jgi:hypothetical protein
VVAVSVDRGGGIPWHRHHAAWLLLLHGTKRWHLYPPSASPPKAAPRVAAAVHVADDDGHEEWIRSVLPSLPAPQRPLEAVQQRGELLYVPEGWCVKMPPPRFSCLGAPNQVYITISHFVFVRLHDSNLSTRMRLAGWLDGWMQVARDNQRRQRIQHRDWRTSTATGEQRLFTPCNGRGASDGSRCLTKTECNPMRRYVAITGACSLR